MNAIAPIRDNARALVEDISVDLQAALPSTIPIERFKATFITAVAHNPEILSCDPQSVKTALMKSAIDNLMPDNREAAIVPFNTKTKDPQTGRETWVKLAQYMPMVQGIRKRALELGGARIHAECVYENDEFVIIAGDDPRIDHKPAPFGKARGEIIGAYAIFKDKDGNILHREAMPKEDIEAARRVSRAKDGPGWTNFYGEFARKTVVRRGAKSIPNIPDKLRTIIERDDDYVDFDQAAAPPRTIEHNPLIDDRPRLQHTPQQPMEIMDRETGEFLPVKGSEAHPGGDALKTTVGQEGDKPRASAAPAESSAGGAGASSSLDARPQKNPPADTSPPGGAGGNGGDSALPPVRVSAAQFMAFNNALARMASEESVRKANVKFWEAADWKAGHPDDRQLCSDILANHVNRANKQVDAKDLADGVKEWVSKITGEVVQ